MKDQGNYVLLMDNCGIHRTKKAINYMDFKEVHKYYNASYRPDLMGVEEMWAMAKRDYRHRLETIYQLDPKMTQQNHIELV